jgi:hypothetical protein
MGDIDRGDASRPQKIIHRANEKRPMFRIQTLARLVQEQQPGPFYQSPRQQHHPLQAGRKTKQGRIGEVKQSEPDKPSADNCPLASSWRLKQADGVAETGSHHTEATRGVIKVQMSITRS